MPSFYRLQGEETEKTVLKSDQDRSIVSLNKLGAVEKGLFKKQDTPQKIFGDMTKQSDKITKEANKNIKKIGVFNPKVK